MPLRHLCLWENEKHLSRDELTKRPQSTKWSHATWQLKDNTASNVHQTRKDGQSFSGLFEILTLFFRRCSPCLSSPGRSRILCLSCAWSRALLFHRKPASKPSSAGSESSMVHPLSSSPPLTACPRAACRLPDCLHSRCLCLVYPQEAHSCPRPFAISPLFLALTLADPHLHPDRARRG